MKKKDLYFLLGALVVIGIFVVLSVIGRKPKPLSNIAEHAGVTSKTEPATCLACHAPDSSVKPMPEHHPKKGRPPDKSSCFICHQAPTTASAFFTFHQFMTEDKFVWRNQPQK
ncbi:MAG: hypothetical protein HY231_07795 [Acidobacteria bacterium]|nr:hypothetical protein [Acidobacteriota bacterium]